MSLITKRKEKDIMQTGTNNGKYMPSRKAIFIRLLYTVLFCAAFEIVKAILYLSIIFQYIYLFITKTHSSSVRNFSNKSNAYAYKIIKYITLCGNTKPFPFSNFPDEIDAPDSSVDF